MTNVKSEMSEGLKAANTQSSRARRLEKNFKKAHSTTTRRLNDFEVSQDAHLSSFLFCLTLKLS